MSEWQETSLGELPIDWNLDSLGKLLYIKGRIGWKGLKKSEYLDEGFAIINGEQIFNDTVAWQRVGRISKERYDESPEIMLKQDDILMTKDGTIGKTAFIQKLVEPATVASGVFVIRENSNRLTQKYLYYFFKSNHFKFLIKSRTEGSVIPHLYQRDFSEMEIPLPDVTEQQKISQLLATLDSKIVNLQNQNQTLEKIAQTLFKQWFVEFNFPDENGKPYKDNGGMMVESELGEIPKGWSIGNLGEIAYFKNGKTSPERSEKNGIPVYGSNGIIGKVIEYNFEHTVIIGRVGSYCGSLYYCMGKCWVTDNAMIGKLKKINSHVFLFLILAANRLNKRSGGSGQPLLNQTILRDIEIILPPELQIEKFETLGQNIYKKISKNQKQIQTLTKTRDTLLPKLMSGQIRVSD